MNSVTYDSFPDWPNGNRLYFFSTFNVTRRTFITCDMLLSLGNEKIKLDSCDTDSHSYIYGRDLLPIYRSRGFFLSQSAFRELWMLWNDCNPPPPKTKKINLPRLRYWYKWIKDVLSFIVFLSFLPSLVLSSL